jgi:hypothetical protein
MCYVDSYDDNLKNCYDCSIYDINNIDGKIVVIIKFIITIYITLLNYIQILTI